LINFRFCPTRAALCNPGTIPATVLAVPTGRALTAPALAPINPIPTKIFSYVLLRFF